MLRKWLGMGVCAAMVAGAAGEPSLDEVMQKLESLQKQVEQQQIVIDRLRQQVQAQQRASTPVAAKTADRKEATGAVKESTSERDTDEPFLKLGGNIDGVTLKGDLRVRYEYRDRDDQNKGNRDRLRTRFRLGGVWQNSTENWEIGAGLATGGTDPTSTNDTWSEDTFFETGNIRLDYAYAKHRTEFHSADLSLTLGQHKNPFVSSWLLYDTDVRPAGFSLQAERCGLFATLGYYDVFNNGDEIVEMWGAQLGYGIETDIASATVAAAFYCYNDSTFKDAAATGAWGYPGPVNSDFDLQIGDLYAEVVLPLGELAELTLLGDYFRNLGAAGNAGEGYYLNPALDAESEDDGWLAGAEIDIGPTTFAYYYAGLAENAANPMLVDSDFATGLGGVDIKAHRFKAAYKLTKHSSISVLAQFAEAMERPNVGDVDLYQIDLKYKF